MRLIDADALLSTENQHYAILADEMYVTVRRVELMPTIDAVPVVRCKECKHSAREQIGYSCEMNYRLATNGKWFCADGERRTETECD